MNLEGMLNKVAFKSDARNWERDVLRVTDAEEIAEEYSNQQLAEYKARLKKALNERGVYFDTLIDNL